MNFPVEILSHIFSFGHPWLYRNYNQVSKLSYVQAEDIKYTFILDMPTKEYLKVSLLKFSDIVKLSLLYDPIVESIGRYDNISLYYYCLLQGKDTNFIPLTMNDKEIYLTSLVKWKFNIKDDSEWGKLLNGDRIGLVYDTIKDVYDYTYIPNIISDNIDIPNVKSAKECLGPMGPMVAAGPMGPTSSVITGSTGNMSHVIRGDMRPMGVQGPVGSMGCMGVQTSTTINVSRINEFIAIIATCGFLSLKERLALISKIERNLPIRPYVCDGIRGNENHMYKNLYKVGAYLAYQYENNGELDSIFSIVGYNIWQIHKFEHISNLGLYYVSTNQHHKYYELKYLNL